MIEIELQYLSADALGLPDWARDVLSTRPQPNVLPRMIVPDRLEAVPRYEEGLQPEDRAELALSLERSLAPFRPHVAVLDAVRALARPEVSLVVVGQQPAFLGGPLFNVYKALHAIRLARALAAFWEAPVLPLFWNHADDHDIAEVHHLWIQNPNLDLLKVGLAGVSSGRTPLSRIVYDAERHRLEATAELLRQNLWESAERDSALDLFLPRSGETFSGSFTRILLELFGSYGLIVLEPDWIRRPLSRALARIVGSGVPEALDREVVRLRAAGLEPAIDPREAVLLWHVDGDRRRALRAVDDEYRYEGESGSRTGAELAAEILQTPEAFSAGALLRPLVQDVVLPVAAYVGGWGELHYHAELPALREETGVARTPFIPRLSATLVDPPTRLALQKLGIDVSGVLAARGALWRGGEAAAHRSELASRLRKVASDSASALLSERSAVAEVERGLAHQLKKAAETFSGLVDRVATKVEHVEANALGSDRRHQRRVSNVLYPRDVPQERVRGALEFVARYGRGWLDLLLEAIEPLPTEHLVVNLVEEVP